MSILNSTKPAMLLFALLFVAALPVTSFAQGRGRGNGAGSKIDKKCAKFVNCHDARDGRWDGRGPAINGGINPVIGSVGIPTYPDIYRNRRNRQQDDDSIDPSTSNRRTDRQRNSSGDGTWRRRRTNSDGTDTRRHRRTSTDGTETRNRRRHDRTND
ncbi:MAG TPA: hypothetical protein VNG71_08770 [Pyrinomonadaceae bacterium]|nr:hypothetical protein [Pyrinomonadaceae bacterium]